MKKLLIFTIIVSILTGFITVTGVFASANTAEDVCAFEEIGAAEIPSFNPLLSSASSGFKIQFFNSTPGKGMSGKKKQNTLLGQGSNITNIYYNADQSNDYISKLYALKIDNNNNTPTVYEDNIDFNKLLLTEEKIFPI
ncbi:MAG TPA: hypothetical protein QF753_04885 [Victivallales bacterium]|nr:hypothetical protein [Victivallales bacterium]